MFVIIRERSFQRIPYPHGVLPVDEDGVGVTGQQLRRHTGRNGESAKPARQQLLAVPFFITSSTCKATCAKSNGGSVDGRRLALVRHERRKDSQLPNDRVARHQFSERLLPTPNSPIHT